LILASPRTVDLPFTIPTPPFSTLPPLATQDEVKKYKSKFLSFTKQKPKSNIAVIKKRRTENECNMEFESVDLSAYLFQTKATLGNLLRERNEYIHSYILIVICPPHLVAQWKSEIESHTTPTLKVIALEVMQSFAQTTYRDIISAG
jgi:hypothetical protein